MGSECASVLAKGTQFGYRKAVLVGLVVVQAERVDPTRDQGRFRRPFTAQRSRNSSRSRVCKRAIKWACKDWNAPPPRKVHC